MVAGGDDAIDRVMPLLQAMSERVFRAGQLGCGHAMKTLNNYVSAAGLAAALDAMVAGQRFGIDVETMLEVFNAGTARNFSTANTLIDEAMSRRYAAGFQLVLMVKDLRIASALFERLGFDAHLATGTRPVRRGPGAARRSARRPVQVGRRLGAQGPRHAATAAAAHSC